MLKYYLEKLEYHKMPKELKKYLTVPSLKRLKGVGYFCGMDYASKDIYQFSERISRYDHSLTVALLAYKLTGDLETAITGLFHDIGTPCFSHVIDYLNKDFERQESTEEETERIVLSDKALLQKLKQDGINPSTIIDFKSNPIIDKKRPALCADRLDGIILTGMAWTKNLTKEDIDRILKNTKVFGNEIGFDDVDVARRVVELNDSIDRACHSKEDNYMMNLLADITRFAISNKYISYQDLFELSEEEMMRIYSCTYGILINGFKKFQTVTKEQIPNIEYPKIKQRVINPLVNGKRLESR